MGSCKVFKRDVFLFPSGAIPNCFQISLFLKKIYMAVYIETVKIEIRFI